MAKPILTQARLKELLHYDPETGIFTWRITRNNFARKGDIAGGPDTTHGYWRIGIDGNKHLASRLAWFYVTGFLPAHDIDHYDGKKINNAFSNLRPAPGSINQQNLKKARKNNITGLLGVHVYRRRNGIQWAACIDSHGKRTHLGFFDSPEKAHAAYLTAKRKLHEGCTI